MEKSVEIISLVFKSIDYTRLIYNQLKSEYCKVDGWDVGVRLLLNDATPEVIDYVKTLDIPYMIYNDKNPSAFWVSRVYRCYNTGVEASKYDNICFVNSDMVFSKNWLQNLLKHHDGKNLPCSRLVEPSLGSTHVITNDFGRNPNNINYDGFYNFVDQISVDEIHDGGLFMPSIFNRQKFIDLGMFPEQGVIDGMGSDRYWFNQLTAQNILKQITVFDSIVYHISSGESQSK